MGDAFRVACECCGGTGKRVLTEFEADTVAAVGAEWRRTPEIMGRLRLPQKIGGPALCNRLVRLEAMGLVERRPVNAKVIEWRAVPARRSR